jgi:hypothetical protein
MLRRKLVAEEEEVSGRCRKLQSAELIDTVHQLVSRG